MRILQQTSLFDNKGAYISECHKYRYKLWRFWQRERGLVLFVGLNPSKADSSQDDPTLYRMQTFAKDWGYGGVLVGNLFAYRSKDPKGLSQTENPVGAYNKAALVEMAKQASIIVLCWGSTKVKNAPENLVDEVLKILPAEKLHHLGLNDNGSPKHPLYLPKTTKPIKL